MTQARSLLTGFGVALLLGGGGGYALSPLAASGRSEAVAGQLNAKASPPRVVIEEVTGVAKVLARGDALRRARVGDTVERPTMLVTEGPDSSITIAQGGSRIIARHDARVVIGAQSGSLTIQLDAGLVIVQARPNQAQVHVPTSQAVLSGEAFGVWAKPDHLVAAVLDGEVLLETASIASKYAKGREIMLTSRGPIPLVLPGQLEIQVEKSEKAGGRTRMTGKTSPNAQVVVRRGNRVDPIDVASNGTFTAEVEDLTDLVAYDAAGRQAEVNRPSQTLDDVVTALTKGAAVAAARPAPAVAAKKEEPAPAKKEEQPAPVAAPAKKEEQQPAPAAVAVEPKAEKKEKPAAAAKEHAPRGSEPSPVKIDVIPTMAKEEPAEPKKEKAAKKKKEKEPKPAAAESPKAAEPAEKTEPEKKGGEEEKPVELQWE